MNRKDTASWYPGRIKSYVEVQSDNDGEDDSGGGSTDQHDFTPSSMTTTAPNSVVFPNITSFPNPIIYSPPMTIKNPPIASGRESEMSRMHHPMIHGQNLSDGTLPPLTTVVVGRQRKKSPFQNYHTHYVPTMHPLRNEGGIRRNAVN